MSLIRTVTVLFFCGCATVSDNQVDAVFDGDGDGFDAMRWGGEDCNDADATVNPGAAERYYDGADANCDARNDFDQDGDGVLAEQGNGADCDDTNPTIFPGAEELQDGLDNDCDQLIDEPPGRVDADLDGFTEEEGDCDDGDEAINPDADERWYDGVDQDCDGASDFDRDGDGFDAQGQGGTDCDDTDPNVNPGAPDPLLGDDRNCDGFP